MPSSSVCVVMSTYNGEKYLREQIESLECQTVVPARIHIRDDGSTDATRQIIEDAASEYGNITYNFCENVGWRLSFIEALRQCGTYDWYAFCDQDDVWLPEKLESALTLLHAQTSIQTSTCEPLVYAGNVTIADVELKPIKLLNETPVDIVNKDFPHTFIADEMAGGLTYVFNEPAKDLLVGFQYPGHTGHDTLLMLICKLFGGVVYDFNSYVLYRQHGANAMGGIFHPTVITFSDKAKSALTDKRQRGILARGLLSIDDDLHRLSVEDRHYLELCATYQKKLSAKIRLLTTRNIGSYRPEQEARLRIRILLGTY